MKRLAVLTAILFLGIGLTAPLTAQAQTNFKVGPRLGIPLGDLADGTSLFFGADARLTTDALPVVPNVSFDYYSTDADNFSVYAVDLNALYEFGIDNQSFVPYAGGGIGITNTSVDVQTQTGTRSVSNSDTALNLVGGARFPLQSVEPFVQLNATLGGDAQRLGLAGGVLFAF